MNIEKQLFIKDIKAGTEINGIFLLAQASQQQAKNGPFWRLEIKDNSGSLEARIWSPMAQNFASISAGVLVEIDARADLYREQIQLSVNNFRVLSEEEQLQINLGDFLLASEYSPDDMLEELIEICKKEILHPPLKKLCSSVLNNDEIVGRLKQAPAAKSIHHAWVGGLLEHILGVVKICQNMADLYPQIDRQILIVGAIFHDFGKIWELSGGLSNDYTTVGKLVGHINIGIEKLEPFIKKAGLEEEYAVHLKHLILSHHGQYEYGSPRLPQTAEAFVLHHADNIDAKLNSFATLFADESDDASTWSPYQSVLQRALYKAPKVCNGKKKQVQHIKEEQCLLPLKG